MNITDINYDKNISIPLKDELLYRALIGDGGVSICENVPNKTKYYQFGRLFNERCGDSVHLEVRVAPKSDEYEVTFDIERSTPKQLRDGLIDAVTKRMSKIPSLSRKPTRGAGRFCISAGVSSIGDKSVAVVLADIKQKMCDLEPCYKIACDAAKNYTK